MEQPPTSPEKGDIEKIIETLPPSREQDNQAILEAGATYGELDMIRKAVEDPLKTAFGKEVKVTDFSPIGGNKYKLLLEIGTDGEEIQHEVEIRE